MGEKVTARNAMRDAGVPILPGSESTIQSDEEAIKIAREIGYPVIVKASGGGGGRGMRIVYSETDLARALEAASTEAAAAFNNGDVYIERYVERPRHIEIQVMADEHGNHKHIVPGPDPKAELNTDKVTASEVAKDNSAGELIFIQTRATRLVASMSASDIQAVLNELQ